LDNDGRGVRGNVSQLQIESTYGGLNDPVGSESFEEVYTAYRRRVRGLCRSLLRGTGDPDDACQDVMLRAYLAWPRFRAGSPVWPWLATITANVCRDAARRSQVATRFAVQETPLVAPDAFDVVAANARARLVRDALDSMPPAYRASLYLREIEGWSLPDIAKARGRSVASVRSTLTRGRRILASKVEELARRRRV